MSVYGLVGNTGSGKTAVLTQFILMHGHCEIYSNYHLEGVKYTLLTCEEDIKNIPKTKIDKLIAVDELHQFGGDSWSYGALAKTLGRFGTQHRKLHADVYYTTQHFGQIINRIRNLTKYIYIPNIPESCYYNGKPIMAKILKCNNNVYGDIRVVKRFNLPLITPWGTFTVDHYDTDEFIDDMKDPIEAKKDLIIEKYKNFNLETKEDEKLLKSKLVLFELIPSGLAGHIVTHLKSL